MLYRLAADLVVLLHAAFVLFVVAGGFLVWRWPRLAWVHVPALLWGAFVEFSGSVCPLTPLENALRQRGLEAGYEGGFIEHYLLPLLYPGELTRELQFLMGAAVLFVNGVVYGFVWYRRYRTPRP
ncbi:MAG TPA: DUF2784 domain-containing protein [Gammaproteobacteria bacterium]|nr:DUF2784 domain-containing protein [Gammaproteobacteria bacterium]